MPVRWLAGIIWRGNATLLPSSVLESKNEKIVIYHYENKVL